MHRYAETSEKQAVTGVEVWEQGATRGHVGGLDTYAPLIQSTYHVRRRLAVFSLRGRKAWTLRVLRR